MKITAATCALALLSVPILVSAQQSSPAPVNVSPAATPAVAPPAHAWTGRPHLSPADLAQSKAFVAKSRAALMKQRALMESSRAKLFASVTPAHRKLVAQIIGELAISAKPDATAAAKQVDAVLSPAEKKAVIAANVEARAQMARLRKQNEALRAQEMAFRKHIMSERIAAGMPTPPAPAMRPTAPRPMIHKNWKTRTPDAGWYLVVAAQFGPHMHGMLVAPQRWDFGPGMHGMGGMRGHRGPHLQLGPGPVIPQH